MIYQSNRTEPLSPSQLELQQHHQHQQAIDDNNRATTSNKQQSSSQSIRNNHENATNNQQADSNQAKRPQPPRQPRPIRPNLRRQVVVAARDIHHQASVPVGTQIELATVLPASRQCLPLSSMVGLPPQRPAHLPSKYDSYGRQLNRPAPPSVAALRVNPETGVPIASPGSGLSKPNRYAWAQVPHWHDQQQQIESNSNGDSYPPHHHHGFQHHFASPLSSAASRVLVVNPMHIVNLSEHTKSRLIKFIEAVKRFSEKWFSHVLLLMFLAVYACFGAYIFISFEASTENWEKQRIIATKEQIVNESYEMAKSMTKEDFHDKFTTKFEEYESLLNRVCASGMTSHSLENQWTFWGALFYSMTVFTTIGYGHLTPITFAGRVATMIYAIFGIPILLMVLADLGKLLTRIIKSAFKKFRYLYNKLLGRKASIRTRKLISDNTNQYIGVARDAFERGFANIQAHNKIQHAFRRVSFRRKNHDQTQQQQHFTELDGQIGEPEYQIIDDPNHPQIPQQKNSLDASNVSEGDSKLQAPQFNLDRKHSVTTDVIVTPVKQTKPVSPTVEDSRKSLVSPLADISTNNSSHHHESSGVGKHHHHHYHGRSQSPGKSQTKKKSSVIKSQAEQQSKSSNQATNKSPISRSSSTSNVPDRHKNKSLGSAAKLAASGDIQQCEKIESLQPKDEIEKDIESNNQEKVAQQPEELIEASEGLPEEEFEELDEDLDIPVSFALFLLVTYMMLGAVVFSIWEGWNFFDALYFVFISMSTIGFGDLVPQHPKRMIGTFIYLLLGLALTSMCINVVQEKIHATFLRAKMQIGEKMGLDLDQIMADDYYEGSMGMGGDEEDATSMAAVSQTNSSLAHNEHLIHQPSSTDQAMMSHSSTATNMAAPDESRKLKSPPNESLGSGNLAPEGSSKLSRSKESLKWKKGRLMGSSSGTSAADHGSSMKRKSSRKIVRQANSTASSAIPATPIVTQHIEPLPPSVSESKAPEPIPEPEPEMTSNSLVVEQAPIASVQVSTSDTLPMQQQQPSINCPVVNDDQERLVCKPLKAADVIAIAARPKLSSTRSHPLPYSFSSDIQSNPLSLSGSSTMRNPSSSSSNKLAQHRGHKSAESSSPRRASVSNELNQLDDLIKVLSRTPSERFGPLLGVPSSTRYSSRSNSPSGSNNLLTSNSRRGTSMRPATTSPRPPIQKKRSLVLPSPSTSAGHLASNNLDLDGVSRESQSALDELESIGKYSIV